VSEQPSVPYAQATELLVEPSEIDFYSKTLNKKIRFKRILIKDYAAMTRLVQDDQLKLLYRLVAFALVNPEITPQQAGNLSPAIIGELSEVIFKESGLSGFEKDAENLVEAPKE
jgi:hypothetical protein